MSTGDGFDVKIKIKVSKFFMKKNENSHQRLLVGVEKVRRLKITFQGSGSSVAKVQPRLERNGIGD